MRPLSREADFGRAAPDRFEDREHRSGVDLIDGHVADRLAVAGQGHRPLGAVLGVLPVAALGLDVGVGDRAEGLLYGLGERGLLLGGAPQGERVDLVGDDPAPQSGVLLAGLFERHLGKGSDGIFALPAARAVAVDPVGPALPEGPEEEALPVAVTSGALDELLKGGVGQLRHNLFPHVSFRRSGRCPAILSTSRTAIAHIMSHTRTCQCKTYQLVGSRKAPVSGR